MGRSIPFSLVPGSLAKGLAALTALQLVLGAAAGAEAALVRTVAAVRGADSTRVVIDIEGEFRFRTHSDQEALVVHVDIDDATLAATAPRIVPVADARVDGLVVQRDSAARIVRVSVDLAARADLHMQSRPEAGRLVLEFSDGHAGGAGSRGGTSVSSPSSGGTAKSLGEVRSSPALRGARPGEGTVAPPRTPEPRRPVPPVAARPVVVLDPGHGGKDPGARAWTGELEKDIVLDLAERVARLLRRDGAVDVVMTRTADAYVGLEERRETSRRWGADAFVSIHANASANDSARGIETYYYRSRAAAAGDVDRGVRRLARAENGGKEPRAARDGRQALVPASTGAQRLAARRDDSQLLATLVQGELVRRLGMRYEAVRDLGAKEGPFFVLGDNAAPSVLVEAAFLTHREEGVRMGSGVYREQIADGIARGVLEFLERQRRDDRL